MNSGILWDTCIDGYLLSVTYITLKRRLLKRNYKISNKLALTYNSQTLVYQLVLNIYKIKRVLCRNNYSFMYNITIFAT